jgi:hypothetical protein
VSLTKNATKILPLGAGAVIPARSSKENFNPLYNKNFLALIAPCSGAEIASERSVVAILASLFILINTILAEMRVLLHNFAHNIH